MTSVELRGIYDFGISLAKRAGRMILEASKQRLEEQEEKEPAEGDLEGIEFVNENCRAVELELRKRIQKQYPGHKIISCETDSGKPIDNDPTWIVSPIDGTTNFIHGVPDVCVSIGFSLKAQPMVGVILNPFKAQLYTAMRSQGSYLTTLDPELCLLLQTQKLPLYPPQPLSIKTSIIAVSEHDRNTTDKRCKDVLDGRIQGVRIYGSTALDFVNVASGFIDAKVSTRHTAREVCAGWLIVMEAGGVVVSGNMGGRKMELMAEPELAVDNLLVVRAAKKEEMEVMVMSYCMLMEDYRKRST